MGKPLSRPGCLRQSPCCSKKSDREGYNEDGYIPQRSIYDTMCINEQIDHSSAHSTLGSRRGRETDFSSNGSLGGDVFDTRSSVLLTSGRRLDERFIFDSLKLANDELRSPGGFGRSTSPSVSCSSAPSGSMNKRHPHQDSGKKDNLCRHSWKVLTPPKFTDALELSPGEKNFLNPGVAFFPNSMTSPQISPFSGSPFSTGTHTPSVFFSPSPLPYHQQFHRQSLPMQPSSPRPPLSELSVSALMCAQDMQEEREMDNRGASVKERVFETFKPKPVEPAAPAAPVESVIDQKHEQPQQPTTPEPESDTAPLLHSQISKGPTVGTASMESTWPRRLIGRRRTVRQGGAVHNLPILPPLPSLLIRSVSDKKPMPRLSPFPEHQGKVEGQLGKSKLKSELKDCSLQDWKIMRQIEEKKAGSLQNEVVKEEVVECSSKTVPVQEKIEEAAEECEVENWEAVLEMVNSLWDETWKDADSQSLGSLRRWPLLNPPTGFGGSQAPSGTSSELGAEDLLELERISREDSLDSELNDLLQYNFQPKQSDVIVKQPTAQTLKKAEIPILLDLDTTETHLGNKYGQTGSPDSNLTLDSDSSGVYMSNPSQTSKEDVTSDGDRSMFELDFGSVTSLKSENEQMSGTFPLGVNISKPLFSHKKHSCVDSSREVNIKETKGTVMQEGSESIDRRSLSQEIHNTVNTSKTDVPLPLSPSKHEVKGALLDPSDMDPFVATDSFVYLAVSVLPPQPQEVVPTPAPKEPSPPTCFTKPCPYPDECDFLSTDSFVYLAAPDCHLLGTEGHSVYGDSNDSEDSGSRAEFVLASTVGDSDWDSDLSDSDPEPGSAKSTWDHWEELEQDVLQGLFYEDQSDREMECHDNQAQQISGQRGELAAIVVQERAEVYSQHTQGGELHTEVKSVS